MRGERRLAEQAAVNHRQTTDISISRTRLKPQSDKMNVASIPRQCRVISSTGKVMAISRLPFWQSLPDGRSKIENKLRNTARGDKPLSYKPGY